LSNEYDEDEPQVVTEEQMQAIAKILNIPYEQIKAKLIGAKDDTVTKWKGMKIGNKLVDDFLKPNNINSHDLIHALTYLLGTNVKPNTPEKSIDEIGESITEEIHFWFHFTEFLRENNPQAVSAIPLGNVSQEEIEKEMKEFNTKPKHRTDGVM
jgi:hypothetical protein